MDAAAALLGELRTSYLPSIDRLLQNPLFEATENPKLCVMRERLKAARTLLASAKVPPLLTVAALEEMKQNLEALPLLQPAAPPLPRPGGACVRADPRMLQAGVAMLRHVGGSAAVLPAPAATTYAPGRSKPLPSVSSSNLAASSSEAPMLADYTATLERVRHVLYAHGDVEAPHEACCKIALNFMLCWERKTVAEAMGVPPEAIDAKEAGGRRTVQSISSCAPLRRLFPEAFNRFKGATQARKLERAAREAEFAKADETIELAAGHVESTEALDADGGEDDDEDGVDVVGSDAEPSARAQTDSYERRRFADERTAEMGMEEYEGFVRHRERGTLATVAFAHLSARNLEGIALVRLPKGGSQKLCEPIQFLAKLCVGQLVNLVERANKKANGGQLAAQVAPISEHWYQAAALELQQEHELLQAQAATSAASLRARTSSVPAPAWGCAPPTLEGSAKRILTGEDVHAPATKRAAATLSVGDAADAGMRLRWC